MKRRDFVIGALASAVAGPAIAMPEPGMPNGHPVGLQLYTIRELMGKDPAAALTLVAEVGYRFVEFAGYFDHQPAEIRRWLDELGLKAPAAHVGQTDLEDNFETLVETASVLGHNYIVLGGLHRADRTSLDAYRRAADKFNTWGEAARANGIRFAYHNHAFEFEGMDGRLPYDVLLERTDPELVDFELDLYWIKAGGEDPLKYFERFSGRFPLWHIKDMDVAGEMADVGDGLIDFAAIFDHAAQAGLQNGFVEHDRPTDPAATIRRSFTALARLRATGPGR